MDLGSSESLERETNPSQVHRVQVLVYIWSQQMGQHTQKKNEWKVMCKVSVTYREELDYSFSLTNWTP